MFRSLRIGFATNSSSSHSIIFHGRKDSHLLDDMKSTPLNSLSNTDNYCFTSKEDKALFILASSGCEFASNHAGIKVSKVLAKHGLSRDLITKARHFDLPVESSGMNSYHHFQQCGFSIADWLDFMLCDEIIMYGYYDSGDDPATGLLCKGHGVQIEWGDVWRKDGNAIVGYNRRTGTKIRWSPDIYEKSSTPELVDMKITDFCGYGCAFCYQGSTKKRVSMPPLERIERILDQLSDMGIFEVAIGGGEPAHHPEFAAILNAATERKITANFTAFGTDWLKNEAIMQALKSMKGAGVGLSIHSHRDLVKFDRVRQTIMDHHLWNLQVMAQTVVGATPFATMDKLLGSAIEKGMPLLLLGYKTTGRGGDFDKRDVSDEKK